MEKKSLEQRKKIAASMLNPLRCGGSYYAEDGTIRYVLGGIPRTTKETNQIIRKMNPNWSEESLKPHLLNEND